VALDGCVRSESVQRLGFGREAKKTAQYLTHTHARTHAHAVSSSNALSSHAYEDPPTNPRKQEDFWPRSAFTHGQLYVAMSHIGWPEGVKLLVTDGWEDAHEDAPAGVYTRNVVYTEVL
jgi:hypothetical protein